MNITSAEIAGPRHACAFFDGPEEEYRLLVPFTKACAKCGDRCFQFLDGNRKTERVQRLEEAGVDVPEMADLRGWDETYLRSGRFDADEMLELAREVLEHGPRVPRARAWTNMEWAARDEAAARELVDYERRVDSVIERTDAIVICTYRVGSYSPEVAMGVLKAHPWILVDGKLEANPAHDPANA